jgi:hypothetical protein
LAWLEPWVPVGHLFRFWMRYAEMREKRNKCTLTRVYLVRCLRQETPVFLPDCAGPLYPLNSGQSGWSPLSSAFVELRTYALAKCRGGLRHARCGERLQPTRRTTYDEAAAAASAYTIDGAYRPFHWIKVGWIGFPHGGAAFQASFIHRDGFDAV